MITKTYSKKRSFALDNLEPPSKHRRIASSPPPPVQDRSSSPPILDQIRSSSPAIASETRQSTPPTSPPPERSSPDPSCLQDLAPNIQSRPRIRSLKSTKPTRLKTPRTQPAKKLTQMTIDLGGSSSARKRCKTCGMEYYPATPEDAALHKRFHAQNVGGVDVPRAYIQGRSRNSILSIDRRSGLGLRRLAEKVLGVVEAELGAINIPADQLWSSTSGDDERLPRYEAHLFVQKNKCVGMCLAERISNAYRVLAPAPTAPATATITSTDPSFQSSSITISDETVPAVLGISRIWVSQSVRNQGIATALLDHGLAALNLPGAGKSVVAFSQPTESGGRLARRWFGREDGWSVYVD